MILYRHIKELGLALIHIYEFFFHQNQAAEFQETALCINDPLETFRSSNVPPRVVGALGIRRL